MRERERKMEIKLRANLSVRQAEAEFEGN